MKSFILLCLGFMFVFIAHSQNPIKLEDISKHIGDSVAVCGKVYTARYLESSKNSPTFLNIGAPFPNQLLTVVIWDSVRKQFEGKPEEMYNNKEICITGRLQLYKEKPQIVIQQLTQIKVPQ